MTRHLRIGIAGLGTVGVGVLNILTMHEGMLEARAGCPLTIKAVTARDRHRDRGVDLNKYTWFDNALDMAASEEIDIVVELMGGADGVAKDFAETAIAAGKHLITANKALIALHGSSLACAAEEVGVTLGYEAAVAGGVPIVKVLREGLAANRVDRIYGILNGTCNYILTAMAHSGRDFQDVLKEAQSLGYAEEDPSFDIDGIDTAHKLSILACLAFGVEIDFEGIHIEGIRHISSIDINFARELGYGIKLLGVATRSEEGIIMRVHPCMVPDDAPINHVNGVLNGIGVTGDSVDATIYEGPGAGAGPTASAVVADILDIARRNNAPVFGVPAHSLESVQTLDIRNCRGPYYIRLTVVDKPGVFADIAAILRENKISMETVVQRGRAPGEPVSVVMTLHDSLEADVALTLEDLSALEAVVEPPRMIRIEASS